MTQANGCRELRRVDSRVGSLLTTAITMGSLRPTVLVARRDQAR